MNDTTSKLIDGATGSWEIVLGLEVHAQVASNAKLFSGAAVGFGPAPTSRSASSTRRCPACCGDQPPLR